jgi:hypothetical protein
LGLPAQRQLLSIDGIFQISERRGRLSFFTQDAVNFKKSLRLAIGFGLHEGPQFRTGYSKPDSILHISSIVYWYQREPHQPLPPMPPASEREPAIVKLSDSGNQKKP